LAPERAVAAPLARGSDATRLRLLDAAERLFAERGIGGVSLREINREAGARNAIAVQYHFGDRTGLVRAVLDRHRPDIDARRHAMLDQIDADGEADLRAYAAALVRPAAAKLSDLSGRRHLQIWAELLARPRPPGPGEPHEDAGGSIDRWRRGVAPLLDVQAVRVHRRFTAIRCAAAELGRRAASGSHGDDRLFVSHLIDLVAGILAAPVSDETVRLADERDAARGRTRV
jgi:AcrR family transcriptional regulator